MDPFTQRMLERARARQEKIDQKLANSGQAVPKRKPLSENIAIVKSEGSPAKSPSKMARESITSPRRQSKDFTKSETPTKAVTKRSSLKPDVASPQRGRNDVVVTKKEFKSSKRGSINRRNSDVSVEINISHRNDIQIEVQVEERDAPISVVYDSQERPGGNVIIKEITDDTSSNLEKATEDTSENKRAGLRHNVKSRLDRLGNLYSDKPTLSSPINRTELEFSSATPPSELEPKQPKQRPQQDGKKKFGRLAALADQINNWEDDLTHHTYQPENTTKKTTAKPEPKNNKQTTAELRNFKQDNKQKTPEPRNIKQDNRQTKAEIKNNKQEKLDASTLDVSVHSIKDINKVLDNTSKAKQTTKQFDSNTFTKPSVNECQRLGRRIVAELGAFPLKRRRTELSADVQESSNHRRDERRDEDFNHCDCTSALSSVRLRFSGNAPL